MKPYVIAIAGPSGAGKSYLAHALASRLPDASVLSLDSYYRDLSNLSLEDRAAVNFDHPAALDEELLVSQIAQLADGSSVDRPVYDFETHSRVDRTDPFIPGRYLIIEGIFALYFDRVRAMTGAKVFVQTPDSQCFERRLDRDTIERGRTPDSVVNQYHQTVRPMAFQYVLPTKAFADVVIPGNQEIGRSVEQVLDAMPAAASLARPA